MKEQVLDAIQRFQLDKEVTKLVNDRVKELVKDHHPVKMSGSFCSCGSSEPHPPHVVGSYSTVANGIGDEMCTGRGGETPEGELVIVREGWGSGSAYDFASWRGYWYVVPIREQFGPGIKLEEEDMVKALLRWIDNVADVEEVAILASEVFGGMINWSVTDPDNDIGVYMFYPNYNEYAGAFGVEFKTQKVTWEITYLCANLECEMSTTPVTLDRLATLNPEPHCHRCGAELKRKEESHERE